MAFSIGIGHKIQIRLMDQVVTLCMTLKFPCKAKNVIGKWKYLTKICLLKEYFMH